MRAARLILLLATATSSLWGQHGSGFPDLTGFSISPTEHIINQVDRPLVVKSVKGVIRCDCGYNEPLADAIFEIRGPDSQTRIRGAHTDRLGRFRASHVPKGTYTFKVTLKGFQSVVGTIVVSQKGTDKIELGLHVGV